VLIIILEYEVIVDVLLNPLTVNMPALPNDISPAGVTKPSCPSLVVLVSKVFAPPDKVFGRVRVILELDIEDGALRIIRLLDVASYNSIWPAVLSP
jgi:hypothetical protein